MNLFLLIGQWGATEGISSGSAESELGIMKDNPEERIFCGLDCSGKVWSWVDWF